MRLAIFGATGRTGRHLLEQALAQGHSVAVLVRDPARLGAAGSAVRVVVGTIDDAARVSETIAGSEAVISALAPAGNGAALRVSRGMDNILAAMKAHGVRRLIVSVGAGIRDPLDRPTPVHAVFGVLVKLLSKNVYADMLRVAEQVRASDLEWTLVRAPRLVDGPATGRVWSGYVSGELGTRITRADLAAAMLKQLTDRSYVRQAPAVSNA